MKFNVSDALCDVKSGNNESAQTYWVLVEQQNGGVWWWLWLSHQMVKVLQIIIWKGIK
jgi:hypothetical protein